MNIGFLASHGGSAARFIVEAIHKGHLEAQAVALISNNSRSVAMAWAKEAGLQTAHLSSQQFSDPSELDQAICDFLLSAKVDTVVLSGYMREIGPRVREAFAGRIINIHPSLLPKHGGKGMYADRVHEAVLQAGDTESGATVHLVTEQIDEGPILYQEKVMVLPDDTLQTLKARVQSIENELMLKAIKHLQ